MIFFFICRNAMINVNLVEGYFSGTACAGGEWSSPCEIGSKESSADQPVCRPLEDVLLARMGYSMSMYWYNTGQGSNLHPFLACIDGSEWERKERGLVYESYKDTKECAQSSKYLSH